MTRTTWIYLLGSFCLLGFLTSCEDPESLGGNLRPDDLTIRTQYVDTFKLEVNTIQLDSVVTMNLSRLIFGHYEHPVFGVTDATAYAQVLPAGDDDVEISLLPDDVDATPIYDSVAFNMSYNYFQGDESLPGTSRIMIYELDAGLDTVGGNQYLSTESIPYTNLLADSSVNFEAETTSTRILLEDDFGRRFFDGVNDGSLNNRTAFAEAFNGIAIKTDGSSNAMFGINPTTTNTSIRVYFHYINDGDTINSTINMFTAVRFHQIESDRTGTPLENLSKTRPINSESMDNQGAVQAGTGITSHIRFPSAILDFGLNNGKIIDRVDLLINPIRGSVDRQSPPPTNLYFAKADVSGLNSARIFNDNGDLIIDYAEDHFGQDITTAYVSGGQSYAILDLTHYIEEVANGETPNNGLIIAPRDQSSSTINHLLFGNALSDDEFPLELRIYYTEFE